MGFLEDCERHFGTRNLYAILKLNDNGKSLTPAQIKKAYYRQSLLCHPDRSSDESQNQVATEQFQIISRAYSILSDGEKRAVYDESGIIDDENVISEDNKDWLAYWRMLFKRVTVKDLELFEAKYKSSPEEREDLLRNYERFKGDMLKIMEYMPCCSRDTDQSRYADVLDAAIESGEAPDYSRYRKTGRLEPTTKEKKKAAKEAKEAEEVLRKLTSGSSSGDGSMTSLENMIQQRQHARATNMNAFFDQLEAKYGDEPKKKARKSSAAKK